MVMGVARAVVGGRRAVCVGWRWWGCGTQDDGRGGGNPSLRRLLPATPIGRRPHLGSGTVFMSVEAGAGLGRYLPW